MLLALLGNSVTETRRHAAPSLATLIATLLLLPAAHAQPKPVPRMQAVPLPYDQVSFQRDGVELTRAHFAGTLKRPFLYPVIGPSGKTLTRMGHPQDPTGHSHHNSVWLSHTKVNDVDFWGDKGKGRIVHQTLEKLTDTDASCSATTLNAWIDEPNQKPLLLERRRITVQPLENNEWMLIIDSQFEAKVDVVFGKTPFGFLGTRMAKTIGVRDGGGRILNSEGGVNEKGVFWKPAKWMEYSGPTVNEKTIEGIVILDHPKNPNHPSAFHVRDDGWMGASFSFADPVKLAAGETLRLRYGLYIEAGASVDTINRRWAEFAKTELDDLTPKKK